jgi:hypothetical protein
MQAPLYALLHQQVWWFLVLGTNTIAVWLTPVKYVYQSAIKDYDRWWVYHPH